MKNEFGRHVMAFCLVMFGVILSYHGYLLASVLCGVFGLIVESEKGKDFFGDEEEPNEEGES